MNVCYAAVVIFFDIAYIVIVVLAYFSLSRYTNTILRVVAYQHTSAAYKVQNNCGNFVSRRLHR